MPVYTLTLPEDAADRISNHLKYFSGSVPAWCASIASDVSRLPTAEIVNLRKHIEDLVRVHGSPGAIESQLEPVPKRKRNKGTFAPSA